MTAHTVYVGKTANSDADFNTIAGAITDLKNTFVASGSDKGKIIILEPGDSDATYACNGQVLTGFSGTMSATSYISIEIADGTHADHTVNSTTYDAWCKGQTPFPADSYDYTVGAALYNSSAGHMLTVRENFTHIHHLAIYQDSEGQSNECLNIRTSTTSDVIFEKIWAKVGDRKEQDCFYGGWFDGDVDVTYWDIVAVCEAESGGNDDARSTINHQVGGGSNRNHDVRIGFCTLDGGGCNEADANTYGTVNMYNQNNGNGNTLVVEVSNTIIFNGDPDDVNEQSEGSFDGMTTHTGEGVLTSDATATKWFGTGSQNTNNCTVSVTDEAATEILVTSLTLNSENYQLINGASAGNTAVGTAQTVGFTVDSRIDQLRDIAGNTRATTVTDRDIGAFETVASGTTVDGIDKEITLAGGTGTVTWGLSVGGIDKEITLGGTTGTVTWGLDVAGIDKQFTLGGTTGTVDLAYSVTGIAAAKTVNETTADVTYGSGNTVDGIDAEITLAGGTGTVDYAYTPIGGIDHEITVNETTGTVTWGLDVDGTAHAITIGETTGTVSLAYNVTGIAAALTLTERTGSVTHGSVTHFVIPHSDVLEGEIVELGDEWYPENILGAAAYFSHPWDLKTGEELNEAGCKIVVGSLDRALEALEATATEIGYRTLSTAEITAAPQAVTIATWCEFITFPDASTWDTFAVYGATPAAGIRGTGLLAHNGGEVEVWRSRPGGVRYHKGSTALSLNTPYFIVGIAQSSGTGTELEIYINGEPDGDGTIAGSGVSTDNIEYAATGYFGITDRNSAAALHTADVRSYSITAWDRVLTQAEIRRLYDEGLHSSVYKKKRPKLYIVGGTSAEAAYNISGTAAALTVNETTGTVALAYNITGIAASKTVGTTTGTVTWGLDVTGIAAGKTLGGTTGTVALDYGITGTAAGLTLGDNTGGVSYVSGDNVIAGVAAGLTLSGTTGVVTHSKIDRGATTAISTDYGSMRLYDAGGGKYFTW